MRRELHVPWVAGGFGDQPYRKTKVSQSMFNVYYAFQSYANSGLSGADFSMRNPGAWSIITMVEGL